tara:strand:- start:68 stop:430 length:363 start_codon:yes stop_codon:yes gene_type:complete
MSIKSWIQKKVIANTLQGTDKEKALANVDNEPWVKVLNVDVNEENVSQGFFELDWNEQFVEMLVENGYTGNSPEETVNGWFTDVCRGIIREESADDFVVDEDVIRTSDLNKKEFNKTKND